MGDTISCIQILAEDSDSKNVVSYTTKYPHHSKNTLSIIYEKDENANIIKPRDEKAPWNVVIQELESAVTSQENTDSISPSTSIQQLEANEISTESLPVNPMVKSSHTHSTNSACTSVEKEENPKLNDHSVIALAMLTAVSGSLHLNQEKTENVEWPQWNGNTGGGNSWPNWNSNGGNNDDAWPKWNK